MKTDAERGPTTRPIQSVRNWHESLSDYLIAHPELRAREVAQEFGVTESWLSLVKNSDAFRTFHSERRKEHFDRVSTGVVDKLEVLSELAVEEMTDQIEAAREERLRGLGSGATLGDLKEVGRLALTSLGFGGNNKSPVTIDQSQNVFVADAEALERAREKMREIRERNDRVLENAC